MMTKTDRNADTAAIPGTASLYKNALRKKMGLLLCLGGVLAALAVVSIGLGRYEVGISQIIHLLAGGKEGAAHTVLWHIRMPRIMAAVISGAALALSGTAVQTLLKNPLASPFTLGISQGAAFGAAFAIVFMGAGMMEAIDPTASGSVVAAPLASSAPPFTLLEPITRFFKGIYAVTFFAFIGAMGATAAILLLAQYRRMTPHAVILAGVALSSLFTSGTILVQFFATETELATVVFWTFGDVSRSNGHEIAIIAFAFGVIFCFYQYQQWNLNSLSSGDPVAKSLGVNVRRLRLQGMFLASLLTALVTAFHGVIAFLGLLAPHIGRKLVGADHRLLIPVSCTVGALLLLAADTAGRMLVTSGSLPVGVLTSFMGAPLFLVLLIGMKER